MASTPPRTNTPTQSTHPAIPLLSRAHSPNTSSSIATDKLRKPLLLVPSTPNKRALRQHIRQHKKQYYLQHARPRPLSAKEKRRLKLHDLDPQEVKYEIYKGLNRLWTGYILEVLGFVRDGEVVGDDGVGLGKERVVTAQAQGSLLASADFHGMEVEVVRCVDSGRVGLKGIVVRESKGCFTLVTIKDRVVRVLKKGAVFRVVIELPCSSSLEAGEKEGEKRKVVFELLGSQLEVRPVDRAVKKFKWHAMDYL